jgi:ATP-binding protein involved in chromosome partitioning
MFKTLKTPIFGMIENMSNFVCPNCSHETPIFGSGGVIMEATELQVPLLGTLPIDLDTRLAGDNGKPAALLGGAAATAYEKIADGFIVSGLV